MVGLESIFSEWMKSTAEFWGSLTRMWPSDVQPVRPEPDAEKFGPSRAQESWASTMKAWQTMAAATREPEALEQLMRGVQMIPEMMWRFSQAGMESFLDVHQKISERIALLGETEKAYDFRDIDKELLSRWTEIYEQEFRQFFHLPQIGLARMYQERVVLSVDRLNTFNAALGEFMHLLYLPIEKTSRVFQEKLVQMAETDSLPDDPKIYYQQWIKILEGHYMTLFQSEEYLRTLGKTLNAMNDFIKAREDVIEDAMKALPVPTNSEMDGLYKEIYRLKRRVRVLEKELNQKEFQA